MAVILSLPLVSTTSLLLISISKQAKVHVDSSCKVQPVSLMTKCKKTSMTEGQEGEDRSRQAAEISIWPETIL